MVRAETTNSHTAGIEANPVPSPRGGALVSLAPPNKVKPPKIEIWNTGNHWRFYQLFYINPTGTNAKPPQTNAKPP